MTGNVKHCRDWRNSRWRIVLWGAAIGVLLVPAIAMQLTDEVAWGPEDFAIMAVMLVAACGAFELVARATGRTLYRAVFGAAIAAAFIAGWAHLAVGVF